MRDTEVATRLNKLNNSSFNCDCDLNHRLNTTFYGGNYLSCLKTVISSKIPYGKCAFIATEEEYLEFALPVQTAVKSVGCKFVGTVISDDCDSVDGASQLFNLPDDVRAVIVFGNTLFNVSAYFATVRNILLIAIPLFPNIAYALSASALFKNGKNLDRVKLTAERCVIFDENIADLDGIPDAYAFIMSKLTALTDYRFNCAVYNKEPCKYAYGLSKKAVSSTFGIINVNPVDIAPTLAEYSAYLGIANAVTGGELYDFSASAVANKLYDGNLATELYISAKLMGVYDLFLNTHTQLTELSDYLARAEYFSKNYPYPQVDVEKGLIAQVRSIRRGEKKLNAVIKSVGAEVGANASFIENVLKVYTALGGKLPDIDDEKLKLSIKHGGDAPYYLNGLSIARYKGVLEYI